MNSEKQADKRVKENQLKEDIKLAVTILNGETGYAFCRNLIDNLFRKTDSSSIEGIYTRLIVIDSLYATNMTKRFFGIHDLASAISGIGDDEVLKVEIQKYKNNEITSKIEELFSGHYGIKKDGNDAGKACSHISKYLYFVNKHDFPIEDTLVKETLRDQSVLDYYGLSDVGFNKGGDEQFLHNIISFCLDRKIKFSEFDNFTWLLGKLRIGSLSLITKDKDVYKKVIGQLELQGTRSNEIDTEISHKLRNDDYIAKISSYISDELHKFLLINQKIHGKVVEV